MKTKDDELLDAAKALLMVLSEVSFADHRLTRAEDRLQKAVEAFATPKGK